MPRDEGNDGWFWITLLLSCLTVISIIFSIWELIEQRFFRDMNYRQLHYLYITRGVGSSLVLAAWAAWLVLMERRKHEKDLRRYRAMLVHAADAVVLFDSDLRVVEWNPKAATLYGYTREEVLGKPLPILAAEEEEVLRRTLMTSSQSEAGAERETKRRSRLGEWLDVCVRLSSFTDSASGQRVFLEIASDLRERIRLRQKAVEIEKLTSMGRMAAGTAHTLNTPLGTMLLGIEMLKDRVTDPASKEELDCLESRTRFCQEFVQKLLHYTRTSEMVWEQVEVGELLDSICTFFRPTFELRRHVLYWSSERLNHSYIWADRTQMEVMFAALLMNAQDALSAKGTVCVDGSITGKHVDLFVRDDGCGVAPEKMNLIFEPFFTTKQAGNGTGLGLPIARNIVETHGGSIQLTNNPTAGVTVRIQLPLCSPETAPSPQNVEAIAI